MQVLPHHKVCIMTIQVIPSFLIVKILEVAYSIKTAIPGKKKLNFFKKKQKPRYLKINEQLET